MTNEDSCPPIDTSFENENCSYIDCKNKAISQTKIGMDQFMVKWNACELHGDHSMFLFFKLQSRNME